MLYSACSCARIIAHGAVSLRSCATLGFTMPHKRRGPKFSGALAEPIYERFGSGVLAMPDDEEKWKARLFGRLEGKLELLLEHYQIDSEHPDRWWMLSLQLAVDFVPGMRIEPAPPSRRGRKPTWRAGGAHELFRAVQDLIVEKQCTEKEAIRQIGARDPRWRHKTPQNLGARYREAKLKNRRAREHVAAAMLSSKPSTLAEIKQAYDMRMSGLFGLGALAVPPPKSDENSGS
jgi:hypothetical protein